MRISEALNHNCEALIHGSSEQMSSQDIKLVVPFFFEIAIDKLYTKWKRTAVVL